MGLALDEEVGGSALGTVAGALRERTSSVEGCPPIVHDVGTTRRIGFTEGAAGAHGTPKLAVPSASGVEHAAIDAYQSVGA